MFQKKLKFCVFRQSVCLPTLRGRVWVYTGNTAQGRRPTKDTRRPRPEGARGPLPPPGVSPAFPRPTLTEDAPESASEPGAGPGPRHPAHACGPPRALRGHRTPGGTGTRRARRGRGPRAPAPRRAAGGAARCGRALRLRKRVPPWARRPLVSVEVSARRPAPRSGPPAACAGLGRDCAPSPAARCFRPGGRARRGRTHAHGHTRRLAHRRGPSGEDVGFHVVSEGRRRRSRPLA